MNARNVENHSSFYSNSISPKNVPENDVNRKKSKFVKKRAATLKRPEDVGVAGQAVDSKNDSFESNVSNGSKSNLDNQAGPLPPQMMQVMN